MVVRLVAVVVASVVCGPCDGFADKGICEQVDGCMFLYNCHEQSDVTCIEMGNFEDMCNSNTFPDCIHDGNSNCFNKSSTTCSSLSNTPQLCSSNDFPSCLIIDGGCISPSSVSCSSFKYSNSCNNNELYDVDCIFINDSCHEYVSSTHTCSSADTNLDNGDLCLAMSKIDCFWVFFFYFFFNFFFDNFFFFFFF
jgi:hypothetical protein